MPRNKKKPQKDSDNDEGEGLTPYQGNNRCFGFFRCPRCRRKWQSGYSWADTAQMCKSCNVEVYPHSQRRLKESEEDEDSKKPHLQRLCGKCKSLGFCCQKLGDSC